MEASRLGKKTETGNRAHKRRKFSYVIPPHIFGRTGLRWGMTLAAKLATKGSGYLALFSVCFVWIFSLSIWATSILFRKGFRSAVLGGLVFFAGALFSHLSRATTESESPYYLLDQLARQMRGAEFTT